MLERLSLKNCILLAAAIAAIGACSSNNNVSYRGFGNQGGSNAAGYPGSGGVYGNGGTYGSGAAYTAGGAYSTGGANATGGNLGNGGITGNGGVPGGGGASSGPPKGYMVEGSWHGYVWTATSGTGSTITPADFSTVPENGPFCASGSVGPMADYSGTAMVGWNLNQAIGATATGTITPAATGITVNVTNTGNSPLRLQIQAADGETNPAHRWCASITGSGGFVPYSSFNTQCWTGGKGVAYNNEPITAALILVPGDSTATVSYSFCLNKLYEGMVDPGNGGTGGSGTGGAGTGGTGTGGASTGGTGTGGKGTGGTATGGAATGGAGGATGPDNGYETWGTWHGYAWTAKSTDAATTITPAPATGFAAVPSGNPLCASGTVGATNNSVAMVGFNVNQAMGANTTVGTVMPTLDGITVSVTNNGTSALRVQIQASDGDTNANHRWCAPIPGNGGFIPWKSFNTACWNNSGTYYDGSVAISAALILVPGNTASTTTFNFCLNSVQPTKDPGSSGSTGCDITGAVGTGSGTTQGAFGLIPVTRDTHNYIVQNNAWGDQSTTQNLTVNGVSFTVNAQNKTKATNGGPVSYPDVFTGNNNGHATTGNNMPKLISSLASVPTGWSNNAGSVSGTYNAAYDVWFNNTNSTGSNTPSGAYLMVWFYKPGNAQPIGKLAASGVSISATNWDVWYDPNATQNGVHVISYVHSGNITSLTFDLKVFIQDAVSRGVLQNSWYLTNIFAGFEIWDGGTGLKTNNFCAVVN